MRSLSEWLKSAVNRRWISTSLFELHSLQLTHSQLHVWFRQSEAVDMNIFKGLSSNEWTVSLHLSCKPWICQTIAASSLSSVLWHFCALEQMLLGGSMSLSKDPHWILILSGWRVLVSTERQDWKGTPAAFEMLTRLNLQDEQRHLRHRWMIFEK